ncbi:universal stress protein [Streptomyces albipurpureus]|uniref:Universal stress protein n=1 Tax=Streptomyces albipurpureus TaxID=2897419 RepID=A0ABT0UPW4_9ACTN|nr:universal stress protein [Streptomyces sp. CWNU-1]MCM2390664.1 universal stress protein [Streptomyces sp. CWNU-1]
MSRTVIAGLDGSRESLAAADWAAQEAKLRGVPLKLVNVWESVPLVQAPFLSAENEQHWAEQLPREAGEELRKAHPDLDITVEQLTGRPADVLPELSKDAELLVLGSSGLGGFTGFLVGSVGQAVVSRTEGPVILVRAVSPVEQPGEEPQEGPAVQGDVRGPIVLGLDANEPDDALIQFAFDAAQRRAVPLRVVHSWNLPPYFAYGLPPDPQLNAELGRIETEKLAEVLEPWRPKYPSVEVIEQVEPGKAVEQLVTASRGASLLVVGRRMRRAPFGGRIGSVAHAVLHHAIAPVAVIPHQ